MKNKDIQLDVFIFRATGRTRTGDLRKRTPDLVLPWRYN